MPTLIAQFPSKSNPEVTHSVFQGDDSVVYCSCPGWRFQRKVPAMRSCPHTKSVAASNLKRTTPVLDKRIAGHLLSTANAKNVTRRSAHDFHKAMVAGGDAALIAARSVLADTTSGYSKNLRSMALAVVASTK